MWHTYIESPCKPCHESKRNRWIYVNKFAKRALCGKIIQNISKSLLSRPEAVGLSRSGWAGVLPECLWRAQSRVGCSTRTLTIFSFWKTSSLLLTDWLTQNQLLHQSVNFVRVFCKSASAAVTKLSCVIVLGLVCVRCETGSDEVRHEEEMFQF